MSLGLVFTLLEKENIKKKKERKKRKYHLPTSLNGRVTFNHREALQPYLQTEGVNGPRCSPEAECFPGSTRAWLHPSAARDSV